jgi:hypothetical protein
MAIIFIAHLSLEKRREHVIHVAGRVVPVDQEASPVAGSACKFDTGGRPRRMVRHVPARSYLVLFSGRKIDDNCRVEKLAAGSHAHDTGAVVIHVANFAARTSYTARRYLKEAPAWQEQMDHLADR